jgi:hypothetical protein
VLDLPLSGTNCTPGLPNVLIVSVARSLEKRLEKLMDGVAGRVFSGRLHPSELAGKLAREADFARFNHATGPATANHFVIDVNPKDLTVDPSKLERLLSAEITAYTTEEGRRLEGPVRVEIRASEKASPGRVTCHVDVVPGPAVVWARLTTRTETLEVGRNRVFIGRAPECDVVASHDDISRRHALLYRERGLIWVHDLSSANGTSIDGVKARDVPLPLSNGSVITLASHRYRFVEKTSA